MWNEHVMILVNVILIGTGLSYLILDRRKLFVCLAIVAGILSLFLNSVFQAIPQVPEEISFDDAWDFGWTKILVTATTVGSYFLLLLVRRRVDGENGFAWILQVCLLQLFSLIIAANFGVALIGSYVAWDLTWEESLHVIPLTMFLMGLSTSASAAVVALSIARGHKLAPYAGIIYSIVLFVVVWICSYATTGGDMRQDYQRFLCIYYLEWPRCTWLTRSPSWEHAWYATAPATLFPVAVLCATAILRGHLVKGVRNRAKLVLPQF